VEELVIGSVLVSLVIGSVLVSLFIAAVALYPFYLMIKHLIKHYFRFKLNFEKELIKLGL
jgi:hypothetical protein